MANRIILGTILALALILPPQVALSVPSQSTKKKSPSAKEQSTTKSDSKGKSSSKAKSSKKSASKSKSSKKTKTASRGRSSRGAASADEPVAAQMANFPSSRSSGSGISETPPLMKVLPQRDGSFKLEPLSPKKTTAPGSPGSKSDLGKAAGSSAEQKFNRFEPWNFSDLVLTQAKYYRDTPYSRGGSLEYGSATDCSGFVQYIYHTFKIDLPRSSAEQAQVGKVVTRDMDFSKLLPGDLLFFSRGGPSVGHAGIYLGEGKMIHASNHRSGVTVTDLRQPYYEGTFVVAKRVFEVKYAN